MQLQGTLSQRMEAERGRHARVIGAWLLLVGAVFGLMTLRERLVPWAWMWAMGLLLFAGFKLLTILHSPATDFTRLSRGRRVGYLAFWPGLRVQPFLQNAAAPSDHAAVWASGCVNLLAGVALLWIAPHFLPDSSPLWVRAWLGMAGICLMLHFGVFDLLAAGWRYLGVPVAKVFDNPLRSTSLAEFWGNRWNRAFSDFARDLIYLPLARRLGAGVAGLVVFLFSGLMHELVISVPAGAGYGGPTLYFVGQALLLRLEHFRPVRGFIRGRPVLGWLWTALAVLGPVPLLLHSAFLHDVVVPFLRVLGA